jgi:hypothetical protein
MTTNGAPQSDDSWGRFAFVIDIEKAGNLMSRRISVRNRNIPLEIVVQNLKEYLKIAEEEFSVEFRRRGV